MATSNHMTQTILSCPEISSAEAINPEFFDLSAGRLFVQAQNQHILCQNILGMFSKPHTNIRLL